jgi:hypothetical protein
MYETIQERQISINYSQLKEYRFLLKVYLANVYESERVELTRGA